MDAEDPIDDLLAHLERMSGLGPATLRRLLEEVHGYFAESVDEFVVRRHAELQRDELRNDDIFARIAGELRGRRFAAPALSMRQLRRIVYG